MCFYYLQTIQSYGSEIDFVTNIPICDNEYVNNVILSDGNKITKPKGNLYCLKSDIDDLITSIKLFEVFVSKIKPDSQLKNIYASAYIFSGRGFSEFICSLPNIENVRINIFAQKSFVGGEHIDIDTLYILSKCVKDIEVYMVGCDPFVPHTKINIITFCKVEDFDAVDGGVGVHHSKFLIAEFDSNNNTYSIAAFGSGNFADHSLTINIEDWIVVKGNDEDKYWWKCIVNFLIKIPAYEFPVTRREYKKCIDTSNSPSIEFENGELAMMLMPIQSRDFFSKIERLFDKADKLVISAQLFKSRRLKELIEYHKDVEVLFIVDDAFVVSLGTDTTLNFVTPDDARDFQKFVDNNDHVEARYLQTNHDFAETGITNTVHLRSMYFTGDDLNVAMIGSAHLNNRSFYNNVEQQIFITGELAEIYYENGLKRLLDRSVEKEEIGLPALE